MTVAMLKTACVLHGRDTSEATGHFFEMIRQRFIVGLLNVAPQQVVHEAAGGSAQARSGYWSPFISSLSRTMADGLLRKRAVVFI